ncbi:unnamed protein product [Adineta steineri]|uniref:Uncharacterized protein n=1 Tax=Adineta steineri TaxID=433720 RepID=A0A815XZA2_9BILA|nr:unnamed protein product [Adineta steineri]CAF1563613.1 unnamed protein product [Adineta steineri]
MPIKLISSKTNSTSIDQKKSLETKIHCIGSFNQQSCLFENLYYFNSEFIILTINGTQFPLYSLRINSFYLSPVEIKKREFNSYIDLENFVRTIIEPIIFPSVTVYFIQLWHDNIGHALFDGLYPAYVALIRFSPRHLQPFRILTELSDCNKCWTEDIYHRFAGLGIIKEPDLKELSKTKWFMFDEMIMGSGTLCQRCLQPNLQLYGGVELDASRLFRNRMYQQHNLIYPITRQKSSSQYRTSYDILQAYIIHNKRFTDGDFHQIMSAIHEINNYTEFYLNKKIKLEWPLINISYLYYHAIKPKNISNRLFIENKFSAQLRVLRQMDIHISAPGTGQMYQTFLSDGSIHINLGSSISENTETVTTYGEQYMTSGTPYIRGLYYPINERVKGIEKNQLVKLIRQAGELILQGFSLPVNPLENLGIDGQLFVEMCKKDKQFCSLVTTRTPETNFACLHFWIEEFIHEYHQWNIRGMIDKKNNKTISCLYNHTLLHELREKYGIEHKDIHN